MQWMGLNEVCRTLQKSSANHTGSFESNARKSTALRWGCSRRGLARRVRVVGPGTFDAPYIVETIKDGNPVEDHRTVRSKIGSEPAWASAPFCVAIHRGRWICCAKRIITLSINLQETHQKDELQAGVSDFDQYLRSLMFLGSELDFFPP